MKAAERAEYSSRTLRARAERAEQATFRAKGARPLRVVEGCLMSIRDESARALGSHRFRDLLLYMSPLNLLPLSLSLRLSPNLIYIVCRIAAGPMQLFPVAVWTSSSLRGPGGGAGAPGQGGGHAPGLHDGPGQDACAATPPP